MPVALSNTEARRRLAALAKQRQRQDEGARALAEDIKEAVRSAQRVLSTSEIARLLQMDRSTLYRTYLNGH